MLMTPPLAAQLEAPPRGEPASHLAALDLKALMNLEVTSVSRRPERLSDAAASIFVITGDEIRRSGAMNLPEALRLAPSLDVVQVHAGSYTVSARGFTDSAGNKLLVLINGRAVYTPLFGGVFWDVQDVLLEEIDRIEVISGPGGTLWGVNAVNGVINIITRSAGSSKGGLVALGGGNEKKIAALRYGAAAGPELDFRVFGKYTDVRSTETANGTHKDDALRKTFGGFRADWERGADQVTLSGSAYHGSEGQPPPGSISTGVRFTLGTITLSGLNLTTRWRRRLSNGSSLTVQGYFDRTERQVPPTFADRLNIADLQIIHSWRLGKRHTVGWGGEYRYGMDRVVNSQYIAFLPAKVNQTWKAIFAQDEMALGKRVRLTLGGRAEGNDYTGTEFLPNARVAWNVTPDHMLWGAASRTVRAPSRLDRDVFVPGVPPFLLPGGPDVVSEVATAYELGYRGQPVPQVTFSATAFHTLYDHLRTQEVAPSRTQFLFANQMEGTVRGIEAWGVYQVMPTWRLSAGGTALNEQFRLAPGSNDLGGLAAREGHDARRSWRLRSSLDLPWQSELDLTARYVSARSNPAVPAYTAVDLRCGWRPRRGLELSVTGTNLAGKGHGEFTDISTRTEVGRGVFIRLV
ncbi:MAG: TonB-dependent receptor, partial [Acidobacteria bacterium]|nr:TonB-dependent receptor [Acidobacteriota bacterium]